MQHPTHLPLIRWALLLLLALPAGCSTNPVTGRDQIVALPAVQAHADIGFALATGARRIVQGGACEGCTDEDVRLRFEEQVTRLATELQAAARGFSPTTFERIGAFDIGVDAGLGASTGSSAGGRIALGAGLARLEPAEEVTAFLIAREMAHVIARHDEENSGVRMFTSALTTLVPAFNIVVRFFASTLGSGALVQSWAADQRREADDIALALLERTGRPAAAVARGLARGLAKDALSQDGWSLAYRESATRVGLVADMPPRFADSSD